MDKKKIYALLAVPAIFSFLIVSLVGCSPAMRKKFVREKKNPEQKTVIPVLDPIEYDNQLQSVKARYDYFYALLKVWHKDALTIFSGNHSVKQMTYTLRQIRLQLEELDKIIEGQPKEKIAEGIRRTEEIIAHYQKPEGFRNKDAIRRDIYLLKDDIIKPLDFESVKNYLRME